MKIKSIHIYQNYNGPGYHGTIEVESRSGKIDLRLGNKEADEIMKIVASNLVDAAKEVATMLTQECIDVAHSTALESTTMLSDLKKEGPK